ncbi:MAG: NAD(P)-dependent oxidoreductase [Desulfobulbaceae bacterium]|nr:NAD(P)-dependent oxidoreductase [Desulfobulbaceae bacterium]
MRIWITGAGGFLGRRLIADISKEEKHQIFAILRQQKDIKDATTLSIDLANDYAAKSIRHAITLHGRPDVVVHLASRQPGDFSNSNYVKGNILTAANLLDGLSSHAPKRLIFTSTISVYSDSELSPLSEESQTQPSHPYGITKLAAENLLKSFDTYSSVVILRLPSLYGVGQANSFIDGLAQIALKGDPIELFGNGLLVRDALHVSDVTLAIKTCLRKSFEDQTTILNLGCGKEITSLNYVKNLANALQSRSSITTVDKVPSNYKSQYARITLAEKKINFCPMTLKNAMRRYADEIRAQP